jgi:hypothetical protein
LLLIQLINHLNWQNKLQCLRTTKIDHTRTAVRTQFINAALDFRLLNTTEMRFQDKNRRLTNSENASYYSV